MSRRRFVRIPPEGVDDVHADLVAVYRNTFTLPPYEESEGDVESFAEKLGRHFEREGFRLVAAYESGGIVGFAYGFDGGEEGWTRGLIEPHLSEDEVEASEAASTTNYCPGFRIEPPRSSPPARPRRRWVCTGSAGGEPSSEVFAFPKRGAHTR